jgi:mannose-6-phosphate isomerase
MELYPLKFTPILHERIWGGNRLESKFGKNLNGKTNIGESWELSAVEGNVSVVANGSLAGNSLQELIEIYMDEIVGEKVFKKYGNEFPLLIKFIDANDDLSIQVHPDDDKAAERHHAFGKTEMWVALDSDDDSQLITGFVCDTDKIEFVKKLNNGTLTDLLNYEKVEKGDAFFIPSGRVHAICKNNLIAEIQQTSDITYRIYDYGRKDQQGNERELHLDNALDVIDYKQVQEPKIRYDMQQNTPVELVSCNYFTTNLLELSKPVLRDYYKHDSFVIYICTKGECVVGAPDGEKITVKAGDTVLLPAALHQSEIKPLIQPTKLLEVYIK